MRAYITDYGKNRLWEEVKDLAAGDNAMRTVRVYRDVKYRSIRGFGGAFTQSSGYCFEKLPKEKQETFLKDYFSKEGLDYNLGRIHINSCDFALENYDYFKEGSRSLDELDYSVDERYLFPMIEGAKKYGEVELLASPWSPSGFMKTNGEMNHGGSLKTEYYGLWAEYMAKVIADYRARGLNITFVSVQNEPAAVQSWDSCIYSAKEEGRFAAGYLRKALDDRGLESVKIFVWDHNKEILFDRARGSMSVEGADKAIGGFAFHWYTGDHFDAVRITAEAFPDKELIFSEGCVEYSRFADSGEVGKAEMYAHDILGNLKAGASAIIDWNLMLDFRGGPNHVGNFCAAPVMCNEDFSDYEKRLSYYYIGHFSKFVKKGARVLATSAFTADIETVAFENPDGSVVTVLLNRTENDCWLALTDGTASNTFTVPAHSIMTVEI